MLRIFYTVLLVSVVAAAGPTFPVWARPRGPRGLSRFPSFPPSLRTVYNPRNLSGSLFFGTCDLPSCDTLEFATLDLASLAKTDLFDFPLDTYDDAFVANDVLIGSFTGQVLPSAVAARNGMKVIFTADSSVNAAGWSAQYRAR